MRRLFVLLLFVPVLSIVAASAPTQETGTCDLATITETLDSISTALADIDDRFETDTAIELRVELRKTRSMVDQLESDCFTLPPTPQPENFYITGGRGVNTRSCPRTSCAVVVVLSYGDAIQVLDTVDGDAVSGSTDWYQIEVDGIEAYVHSSLAGRNRPPTPRPAPPPTRVPAQAQPAQPAQSVPEPISTQPPQQSQAPAPQFTCSCSKTCGQMASCQEAYFQLNECGCGRRDGDNDGVPCESICSGG